MLLLSVGFIRDCLLECIVCISPFNLIVVLSLKQMSHTI